MEENNKQLMPSSAVIESARFRAVVYLEAADERAKAEEVARIIRTRYSNDYDSDYGPMQLVPVGWEPDGGFVTLRLVGQVRGNRLYEEWTPEGEQKSMRAATVKTVAAHLEEVFGGVAEAWALCAQHDCPEDLHLLALLGQRLRKDSRYLTAADVRSSQERAAGRSGTYEGDRAPFFTGVFVTNAAPEEFDRKTYAMACGALAGAERILVVPQAVIRRADGRWEIRAAGKQDEPRGMFGRPYRISDEVPAAIAHYLDCEVEEFRTFGMTAADVADIAEVERLREELDGADTPDAADFVVVGSAEDAETGAAGRPRGEALSGEEELNRLIGLGPVKEQILEFVDYAAACKARGAVMPSLHLWMTGNPGTGKTTVARIIGHLLYDRGIIPRRDVFVEGDRETLVGEYVGSTAVKTKAAIRKARHGVLFIDEAYALNDHKRGMYGDEALATLVKAMEDSGRNFARDGFVCIMAGYPRPMEEMVAVNPGLRDRFGFKLEFPDYTADELVQVFGLLAEGEGFAVEDAAKALVSEHFGRIVRRKGEDFGNARLVRKIFERCKMRQARLFGDDAILRAATVESVMADGDFAEKLDGVREARSIGFVA